MPQHISDVMTADPVTCTADDTVRDAARAMRDHAIGDVIVMDQYKLCGVVTDRDIVVRAIAEERDPATTALRDICSKDPRCLTPDDKVESAVELMKRTAVRRVPITDGGTLVGVVTMGDLALQRDEHSALAAVSAAPPNR